MTRARRIVGWTAAALGALLLTTALIVAGTLWWSLRSERGNAWLLSLLPYIQVDGPRGQLIGDFSAQKVVVTLPGTRDTITLTGLSWRDLSVARTSGAQYLRIQVPELEIARIDLAFAPSKEPAKAPANLALPIELDITALHVGALYPAPAAQPVRDLRAHLHLGANAGAEHRVDALTLGWDRLQVSGDARIGSAAPMQLSASIKLAQQTADSLPAWDASATLAGPLAEPQLQATLRAAPSANRPAQTLDAHAHLRPFAAWPLGELQASTKALDLSAFASAAPVTALTGHATATTTALDQPATLTLALVNDQAGRWNDGKLPGQRIEAALVGRPDQPNVLTVQSLRAELGMPRAAAGVVTGAGRWTPSGWSLEAKLDDVQPALLDARAPAMRLSGPLTLRGDDATHVKAELRGPLAGVKTTRPVQLLLDATLTPQRVELRDLQAIAGDARAQVSGLLTHPAADAPWALKAKAALVDFDPTLWWPGREDSPWRRTTHRLNANGDVDVSLPAAAASSAPLAALRALRGQAAVTIKPSQLAGVPIDGQLKLRSNGSAQADASAELNADGNRLQADGRIAVNGDGAADVWNLRIDALTLARLAPIYRLLQPGSGDAAFAGALTASAKLNGRWPQMTSQGQLDASVLRAGNLSVQKAQGQWAMGSSANAAVDAQFNVTQAGITRGNAAGPSIETAQLTLKGTGRAHTLELRASSKARPPTWVEAMPVTSPATAASAAPANASNSTAPTTALLLAQGGLIDLPNAPLGGWRGSVQQIELRSATPLVSARNIALEAAWGGNTPARAAVQPGRAEVLGGAVRWSRISWQAAASVSGYAQIEAEAEVEPLRVAPLLARAQPDFGWSGDLMVSAHLKLRSAPTFSADVVIERSSGDLTVTEELGTRALGLTDLRLGLQADNGTWNFTQGLAGKTLGVAAGAVVVRTAPEATWPPADAPIQGVLELQVADLGTWGTWVPPGWRLAGALRASAGINGRFGAPEYTGQVVGTQLGVRNFLQGVNVSDGDVEINLQGSSARIERFNAKGGTGSIKLEGSASLGEAPKAVLQVTADKFTLLGRVDRRIVTSGQGRLQLDAKSLAFEGQFGVDDGLIDFTRSDAPSLSDDVEVVRNRPKPSADAPQPAPVNPSRDVSLDLRVSLGDKLRLRGRGIDTGLSGDLRITSPGGRLAVNGTVRAVDGTYAAYGQKLSIDRGLISFNGPVENPRLDIEATRPNTDVRVGVAVTGNATNPRIRLFSEPELSELDKLSWLVMGRASDGLGRTDTALVQRAALALLAGEGGGVTDQFTKALGLDDIGVRQTDGEVRETVISLGKQLSRRWYVGYERGLNATTGNFQLIYRIAQRFTLRAQSGEDNSLDVIWTWRWK